MRKLFSLICILLFIIGCSDKRPADVLSQGKMREVIWDMLKTGEFLDAYVLNKDTALDKAATIKAWYDKVYQLHKITKTQFEKSYTYYQDRPALMKEMLDTLSKRQLPLTDPNPADSTIRKDSAPASVTPPVRPPLYMPGKSRIHNIDSLKRFRKLQRMERLEERLQQ